MDSRVGCVKGFFPGLSREKFARGRGERPKRLTFCRLRIIVKQYVSGKRFLISDGGVLNDDRKGRPMTAGGSQP